MLTQPWRKSWGKSRLPFAHHLGRHWPQNALQSVHVYVSVLARRKRPRQSWM